MARTVICPYCHNPAKLVTGLALYKHRPDLKSLSFWRCDPCDAHVGCHKGSDAPLGRLADKELRKWKSIAHSAFDPIWKDKLLSRSDAYKWLAAKLRIEEKYCHIGMFDVTKCMLVLSVCKEFRRGKREEGCLDQSGGMVETPTLGEAGVLEARATSVQA